jgi:hypothetical protein
MTPKVRMYFLFIFNIKKPNMIEENMAINVGMDNRRSTAAVLLKVLYSMSDAGVNGVSAIIVKVVNNNAMTNIFFLKRSLVIILYSFGFHIALCNHGITKDFIYNRYKQ